MIKCPKNTGQTDKGTRHVEVRCQQSCCYATLLKLNIVVSAPPQIRLIPLKRSQNTTPLRSCFRCIWNTTIVNMVNLHLMWQKPEGVFKKDLLYWRKESRRGVSFYWKKLAAILSSIIFFFRPLFEQQKVIPLFFVFPEAKVSNNWFS